MALIDRVIKETAEALEIDVSEVDWITEASLEHAAFGSDADPGFDADEGADLAALIPQATCTPIQKYAPKYKLYHYGQYCSGKKVYTWSGPSAPGTSTVWRGWDVIVWGSQYYYKQATGLG